MSSNDPLRELVVDTVEVDRKRIADALRGVIVIDKTGSVLPSHEFGRLTASQKVLAYLLGRKVAVLLDLAEEEPIGPKDLARQTGQAEGTVYPTVRKLHESRLVSQDVDSGYYLSPHQVGTAIEELLRKAEDDLGRVDSRPRARRGRSRGSGSPRTRTKTSRGPNEEANEQTDDASAQKASTKSKRSASEFSPTDSIRDLIGQGFFDSSRSLSDVQQWFKDKRGRDVPQTTLSPIFTRLLREEALDRTKGEDGSYRYATHRGR